MCLIFMGQGYPRKLFNLEHFPIYGNYAVNQNLGRQVNWAHEYGLSAYKYNCIGISCLFESHALCCLHA